MPLLAQRSVFLSAGLIGILGPLLGCGVNATKPAEDGGGGAVAAAKPGQEGKGGDKTGEIVQGILRAKSSEDADAGFKALFELAEKDGLRSLKTHPHNTIALRAAWEEVRRTKVDKDPKSAELHSRQLSRFVGFVEGRLHVDLPEWWEKEMEGSEPAWQARVYGKTGIRLARGDEAWVPPGTSVELRDGKAVLKVGKESVTLAKAVFEDVAKGGRVSAWLDAQRCYVAGHGRFMSEYLLYCIDRKTGEVLWKAKVWAPSFFRGGGGGMIPPHVVEIKAHEDRVIVFGSGFDAMYVEAFSAKDGSNLYRFTTGSGRD